MRIRRREDSEMSEVNDSGKLYDIYVRVQEDEWRQMAKGNRLTVMI